MAMTMEELARSLAATDEVVEQMRVAISVHAAHFFVHAFLIGKLMARADTNLCDLRHELARSTHKPEWGHIEGTALAVFDSLTGFNASQ